tara:strand:- start:139 stop:417 length:279 start_codon:yes stop_codon:yes gene_type:complete
MPQSTRTKCSDGVIVEKSQITTNITLTVSTTALGEKPVCVTTDFGPFFLDRPNYKYRGIIPEEAETFEELGAPDEYREVDGKHALKMLVCAL